MIFEPFKKQIFGLTGFYASGKSTVAQIFFSCGYHIIEMDQLGHQALMIQKKKFSRLLVRMFFVLMVLSIENDSLKLFLMTSKNFPF